MGWEAPGAPPLNPFLKAIRSREINDWQHLMMTSSSGNIFRVTGLLCRKFTGDRWIPRTKASVNGEFPAQKASDAELWCFLWSEKKQMRNNGETGDLRRHRAHYDVTVMSRVVHTVRVLLYFVWYKSVVPIFFRIAWQALGKSLFIWLTQLRRTTMHLFHIPQCTIQNRNVYISVLYSALWDLEQVHWGICEIVLLSRCHWSKTIPTPHLVTLKKIMLQSNQTQQNRVCIY